MKLNSKIKNNTGLVLVSLLVFAALIGLSCISASDVNSTDDAPAIIAEDSSDAGIVLDENDTFVMSVPYNSGTGYHWEISPESYGVDLASQDNVLDHPDMCGSSGTAYFNFHVNSDSYYVKLILVSPTGDIVNEVDSNMIN